MVRFKGPETGVTHWHDLIKGPIAFDNQELDDLVILRGDGIPTYNFAVVVDDLTMGVTLIIRGEDHIPNTPRQIVIYQALGAELPQFAHMPLMLATDRGKLSKRQGAIVGAGIPGPGLPAPGLVQLSGPPGLVPRRPGDLQPGRADPILHPGARDHVPGVFDEEKLQWLNSQYLKEPAPAELARELPVSGLLDSTRRIRNTWPGWCPP